MDKTLIRNRRASAAYRRRLRETAAPTARDAAAAILDSLVDQAARAGRSSFTPLVASLVDRGFDAEASARLLAGLVARRVEALRDAGHMDQC